MTKRRAMLTFCLLLLVAAGAAAFLWREKINPAMTLSHGNMLRGFAPGTRVTYKIFPERGSAVTGTRVVDSQGQLEIPPYLSPGGAPLPASLTYDFMLEDPAQQKPVSVTMTLNSRTGGVTVHGRGLGMFTPIKIQSENEAAQMAADWTGAIRSIDDIRMSAVRPGAPVQLAFSANNIGSDVIDPHPRIIQALWAPGGGGPGPEGVNEFDPTHYSSCTPPEDYSYCPPTHINDFTRQTRSLTEWSIVWSYVQALKLMTEQLSAVMMQQMQIVGSFFDAQNDLQAQREMQRLTAQAHKDYHPGELMCEFGSFIKSVPQAEQKAAFEKEAMNSALMTVYTNSKNAVSAEGYATDMASRIEQFKTVYCDPQDNNNGLTLMCGDGGTERKRLNSDIDYTRTAGTPLTLDINLSDQSKTNDEEDVLALARHLYWPRVLEPGERDSLGEKPQAYANARNLFAVQNVAHNSFANIMGMKSKADPGLGAQSGWAFMKAYLKEFGLSPADIDQMLGQNPSYYAQMDVLTKKIYQNPNFYTNLYDKPANVRRIGVSMDAISLMQMRDQYESALRKEMLLSLMLEQELKKRAGQVRAAIDSTPAR